MTIKDVMTKAHKPKGLLPALRKALNSGEPDWATIQKQTKELATLARTLGKNDPPKGERESWEKLTKAYTNNAEALEAAAEKEDKVSARAAQAKLSGSCLTCHKAHKGQS
jgi:hypothetical protein